MTLITVVINFECLLQIFTDHFCENLRRGNFCADLC
jgi:hypothetical protein